MAAEYNPHFQRLFTIFMSQLQGVLAPAVNIPMAYENGSDEEQAFIQNLALFLTAFFRVRGLHSSSCWRVHPSIPRSCALGSRQL